MSETRLHTSKDTRRLLKMQAAREDMSLAQYLGEIAECLDWIELPELKRLAAWSQDHETSLTEFLDKHATD